MSHAIASSLPPPRQKPDTAATTGFLILRSRSQREMASPKSMSTVPAPAISLMSAPAANARSFPVTTMQPIAGSRSKSSSAVISSSISVALSAFNSLGRLRRTRPTLSWVSVRMNW
ncbi:MAG: hypothetical protein HW378_3152 [Anaerolineales bacterium]|nr:hypothetical protein [Anaerolineales bacterium]